MDMHEPWLTCQRSGKTYLLAQDHKAYYIIDVNDRLSWETEEWLAQQGVTETILKELTLRYDCISKSDVRGVAVGGCMAGDFIYLYLKSGKRLRHMLTLDYEAAELDHFFGGLQRFTPPVDQQKKKRDAAYWRKEQQDPDILNKLKIVVPALSLLSTVFSIGYAMNEGWLLYLGCLLCIAAPVVLEVVLPAYFTLLPREEGERSTYAWNVRWPLAIHLLILLLLPQSNWLNENSFFVVAGICGTGAVLVLGTLAEEFKRNKKYLWMVFVVAGVMGTLPVGQANEAFDFSVPETYTLVVEDLEHTDSRRNSTYECTVTLPDGRQVELEIPWSTYAELEVGDRVCVEHSVGALGIEYANVYLLE